MNKCWSPITPTVALVGFEVAVFAILLGWSLLAWVGLLGSGPVSGVLLTAIIVNGLITLALPVVHTVSARLQRLNCPGNA